MIRILTLLSMEPRNEKRTLELRNLPELKSKRRMRKPKRRRRQEKYKLDELLPRKWLEIRWRRIE